MKRTWLVVPMVLALAAGSALKPVVAYAQDPQLNAAVSFTPDQIDNLVGPVALYPDALLAQVLVAATFPDQIDAAVRYVRANGTAGIDDQPWDVSVKSVAHYPTTLNMMADKLDWTTALGQAYAAQSSDVMQSVQHLRAMANSQGNLVSTPQQNVIVDNGEYEIVPAQAQVIYVPVYDPVVIYTRPVYYRGGWGGFWSFGIGFPIGAWLSYDMDWHNRRVFYDGWNGGGWRLRSRPFIHITNVYVSPRYTNVYVNREVIHRSVNYGNVERYNGLHRDVHYTGRGSNDGRYEGSGNRNLDRNIDHRDPRLNDYRGRAPEPQQPARGEPSRGEPSRGEPSRGEPNRGQPSRGEPNRGQPSRPEQEHPVPTGGRSMPAPVAQPAPHTFGRSEGHFDPNEASRRGEASRTAPPVMPPRMAVPRQPEVRPTPAPAPAVRPAPAARPPQQRPAPAPDKGGRRPEDPKKRP